MSSSNRKVSAITEGEGGSLADNNPNENDRVWRVVRFMGVRFDTILLEAAVDRDGGLGIEVSELGWSWRWKVSMIIYQSAAIIYTPKHERVVHVYGEDYRILAR